MRNVAQRVLVVVTAAIALLASAKAQYITNPPPPHVDTLDLQIARSSRVAIGTIVDILPLTNTPRDFYYQEVWILVKENLKGGSSDRVLIRLGEGPEELARWKENSSSLLILVPLDKEGQTTAIDLSDPGLLVVTANLDVLRRSDAVAKAAKEASRQRREIAKAGSFGVLVPSGKAAGTRLDSKEPSVRPRGFFTAEVPIDDRLEKYALREVDSQNSWQRMNGIQALARFKSVANIRRLTRLLEDDSGWDDAYWDEGNNLLHRQYNNVRASAFQALQALNVSSLAPVSLRPASSEAQVIETQLDFNEVQATEIDDLARYPNLANLYLSNAKLTDAQFAKVGRLKSLRTLVLDSSNVSDSNLTSLEQLPNLVYLGLGNTVVTDRGLLKLAHFKRLNKVDVGQAVTESGVAELQRLRPDMNVRLDEFAFLAALRPRRLDEPHRFCRNYLLPSTSVHLEAAGVRTYALIFPRETVGQLDDMLARVLPSKGWKKDHAGGYTRKGVPIKVSGQNYSVDKVSFVNASAVVWKRLSLGSGERIVMITTNVDPR